MCVCVRGFSCVPLMTAAQQGGNTHSILWPSRVLTSLPWQRRLMLSDRSDLPLTEIRLQASHLLVSLSHLQYINLSFSHTHTHTYPYALHMQLNYILTVWARGELPGCEAPCWPLCSSRLKPFEEQRLYKFTLSSTYSIYPSFFLSSVDSPLTPHDSLSYAGSQAKSSLKIGWNRCDFKSQPLV